MKFNLNTPGYDAVAGIEPTVLISALLNDPLTGISIARLSGELVYANDQAARIFLGDDSQAGSFVGRSMWEVFPKDWMRERVDVGAEVLRSRVPALLRTVWRGRQVLSWLTPLDTEGEDDQGRILAISRHSTEQVAGDEDAGGRYSFHESKLIRLGELDALSPRELEVLALVGQGLSIKEIAELFGRSEKTVQNHRDSIGAKLGLGNRVHVAAAARRAGLTTRDADKARV